jgi:hypothetical protein
MSLLKKDQLVNDENNNLSESNKKKQIMDICVTILNHDDYGLQLSTEFNSDPDNFNNLIKTIIYKLGTYSLKNDIFYLPDDFITFKTTYSSSDKFLIGDKDSLIFPAVLSWNGSSFKLDGDLFGLGIKPNTPYSIYGPIGTRVDSLTNTSFTITFDKSNLVFSSQITKIITSVLQNFLKQLTTISYSKNYFYYINPPDYSQSTSLDIILSNKIICLYLTSFKL